MRPPLKGFTREVQVGLFALVGFFVVAVFSLRITDSPVFRRGTVLVTYLGDATGVFLNSKVKLAGIDVGAVKKIELENGKAKVTLVIDEGVEIPKDSHIEARPQGILGDKYLEVVLPGPSPSSYLPPRPMGPSWLQRLLEMVMPSARAQAPAPKKAPNMGSGDVIPAKSSPATIDDLARQLGAISGDVQALTTKLNGMLDDNSPEIRELVRSLNRTGRKLERIFGQVDPDRVGRDLKDLSGAAGNVSRSLQKVEGLLERVEKGEGTVGKLLNDPAIALELQRAMETLNTALDRVNRTVLVMDLSAESYFPAKSSKTYVSLEIRPKEDVAYVGGLVIDPRGTFERVITTDRTTTTVGGVSTEEEIVRDRTVNDREAVYFTLMMEKRIWNFAARIGILENKGGLGFDYHLLGDRLRFGADLFHLTRDGNNPHLKAHVKFSFLDYFYLIAGGDELLSRVKSGTGSPSFMAGIGLRFTDEDAKTVLLLPGVP
jgi:phospholipid/cholesterol/gamma-HCH transport system substrate-binding protein